MLTTHGSVSASRLAELTEWVHDQRITEQMFRAVHAAGLVIADIVHMDEYTIDIVVPLADGLVLVYDTT